MGLRAQDHPTKYQDDGTREDPLYNERRHKTNERQSAYRGDRYPRLYDTRTMTCHSPFRGSEGRMLHLDAIPNNSPCSWRLRKAITKVTHLAEDGLQQKHYNQERICQLERDRQEQHRKKSQNRSFIPTEGRAWVGKEEIREHFQKQEEQRQKRTQKKKETAENSIARLSKSLETLLEKKRKVEALESAGHLPKRCKTSLQLIAEEEVLQLHLDKVKETFERLIVNYNDENEDDGGDNKSEDDGGDDDGGSNDDTTPCPVIY
ncbi:hypothetical protein HOY80DRAFT_1036678 [Tuber brumale]|nr:hypothetical protein HOY80DRAFT_1036678 [Tuber brumale]